MRVDVAERASEKMLRERYFFYKIYYCWRAAILRARVDMPPRAQSRHTLLVYRRERC